jgi:hypothetical protein
MIDAWIWKREAMTLLEEAVEKVLGGGAGEGEGKGDLTGDGMGYLYD